MAAVGMGVLAAVAVASLVVGGVGGYLVHSQVAAESCRVGTEVHPTEARCAHFTEICTVWLDGRSNDTEGCLASSEDGSGLLRVLLEGEGVVRINVIQGAINRTYEKSFTFPAGQDIPLSGQPGTWKLIATFREAEGHARITVWG